jgi:Flp pilus assembly protein TadD
MEDDERINMEDDEHGPISGEIPMPLFDTTEGDENAAGRLLSEQREDKSRSARSESSDGTENSQIVRKWGRFLRHHGPWLTALIALMMGLVNNFQSSRAQRILDKLKADQLLDEAQDDLGWRSTPADAARGYRLRPSLCARDDREEMRLGKARRKIEEALRLSPHHLRGLLMLAEVLVERGDKPDRKYALKVLREALRRRPDDPELLGSLGSVLFYDGQVNEATEIYERALKIDRENVANLSSLGAVLQNLGRVDEAERRLKQALSLDPFYVDASITLGALYRDQKKTAEAMHRFRLAAGLNPTIADIHGHLGYLLAITGHLLEAADEYDRAIKLAPNCGQYYHNLAVIYRKTDRDREAQELLATAESLGITGEGAGRSAPGEEVGAASAPE